ncbi:MAG: diguanylate cyclase [Polyangiales bacterium]
MAFAKAGVETDALEAWAPVSRAAGIAGAASLLLSVAHFVLGGHDTVAYILLVTGAGFGASAILSRREHSLGVSLLPVVALFGVFGMAFFDGGLQSEALPWAPFAAMLVPACLGGVSMRVASMAVLVLPCILLLGTSPDTAHWLRWLEVEGALILAMALALAFVRWRQESLSALREEHSRLQLVIDNLPSGIALTDQDGLVVAANERLRTILEIGEENFVGQNFATLLKDRSEPEPGSGSVEGVEGLSAEQVKVGERVFEVSSESHGPTLALWSLHEVTQRVRSFAAALGQLQKDALTGLYNRAYLMRQLKRAIQADQSFALLFIDLDGFKAINDEHGHAAGDRVLSAVASRLRSVVRNGDDACRLGGDEFCVVAYGVQEAEQAGIIATKVIAAIRSPYEGLSLLGSSIGVALYPEAGRSAEDLLECADTAMYASKRGGGNSWVLGGSGLDTKATSPTRDQG